MKIALFGGAFDPPHLGHQRVAAELIAQQVVDEVRYVPVKEHAFSRQMSPAEHRLAMCQLLTNGQIKVETFELDQAGISYSYHTLQALSKLEPDHKFAWVIGSDNLAQFRQWKEYQQLLTKFGVYVYPRPQYPLKPILPGMTPLTKLPVVEISSTLVREKLAAGESVDDLVGLQIAQYIQRHHLYN